MNTPWRYRARQHVVDQMRRGVRHPPRCTRRTQAATLQLNATTISWWHVVQRTREAMGEDATAQVLGELALDVGDHRPQVAEIRLRPHDHRHVEHHHGKPPAPRP